MVSQDRCDKTRRLIGELTIVDMEDSEVMHRSSMELIREFLVYANRTYRDINPYLKGLYLTLDIWRPYEYKEGWLLQVNS